MTISQSILAGLNEGASQPSIAPSQWQDLLLSKCSSDLVRRPTEMKGIILDFGSLFPGDLQGEEFVSIGLPQMKWFFRSFVSGLKDLNLDVHVSFTSPGHQETLNDYFRPLSVRAEQRNLSLSHIDRWSDSGMLAVSMNHLLDIVDALRQGPSDLGLALVCLWGNIEKVGAHWLSTNISLNEIFELKAAGESRIEGILVDGPLGRRMAWNEVKDKTLKELGLQPRTLHFLSSQSEGAFARTWNEFFYQDQCMDCLPCTIVRKRMKDEEALVFLFKGKMAYGCELPNMYRRGSKIWSEVSKQESPQ